MTDPQIQAMIDYVERDAKANPTYTHVIVMVVEEEDPMSMLGGAGVRIRCETNGVCDVMAMILGKSAKVLTKEEFVKGLKSL